MTHEKGAYFLSALLFAFIFFMVCTMISDSFVLYGKTSENSQIIVEESNNILLTSDSILNSIEPTVEPTVNQSVEPTPEPTIEPTIENSQQVNTYPSLTGIKYYTVAMDRHFNYPDTYSYYLVDSYLEYLSLYHDSEYLTINDKDIPVIQESFFEEKMLLMFTIVENTPSIRIVSRNNENVNFQLSDKSTTSRIAPTLYIVEFDKKYLQGASLITAHIKYKEYDNDLEFLYKECVRFP